MSLNWSYIAEQYIAGILGMVPEVGSMLSAFLYILWPSPTEDVWAEVQEQTEELIDEKLDASVQQQVNADLAGLYNVITDYLNEVPTDDYAEIARRWTSAKEVFLATMPTFMMKDYQFLLVTDFVQMGNMYLSLLRDGIIGGPTWGWNEQTVQNTADELTSRIAEFSNYVQNVYNTQLATYPNSLTNVYQWNERNAYIRTMTLTALDFVNMWPYFDISVYPDPVTFYLDREIYTDYCGTNTDSGALHIPGPPSQPITQVSVWGWDRIDAVQVTYPSGGGPNGETVTPRMGDSSGGENTSPHGGVFDTSANAVTQVNLGTSAIINYMFLWFADGSESYKLGGNYPGGEDHIFTFGNEIVSSFFINGVSNYYKSADGIVCGFKYINPMPRITPDSEAMYVVLPKVTQADAPMAWQTKRAEIWGARTVKKTV